MNRAILAAAAVAALMTAAPALAQPGPFGLGLGAGVSLDARIDQSVRAGNLSNAEAARLRADARALAELEARYRARGGGVDAWERQDLERRRADLDARLNVNVRGPGPGQGPAYGPNPGAVNGWQAVNARLPQLERRIDDALRAGMVSGAEAARLRAEVRALAQLDARYRATGGLQAWERDDLERRFAQLDARIRFDHASARPGVNVQARQAQFERRIEQGLRNRSLSPRDAARLRAEFRDIATLEARYRATGGLQPWEIQDLDRRFATLESRLRVELADRNFRWDDVRYR